MDIAAPTFGAVLLFAFAALRFVIEILSFTLCQGCGCAGYMSGDPLIRGQVILHLVCIWLRLKGDSSVAGPHRIATSYYPSAGEIAGEF